MPRLKLLLSFIVLALPIFLLSPSLAYAASSGPAPLPGTTSAGVTPPPLVSSNAPNIHGKCAESEVDTALGCLAFDLAGGGLVKSILTLATGVGGAIALILMLYGFFILSTSAGIPDKIKEGQEIITGAVGGLLFILFATIMMNLIGIKILSLPGLQ